VVQELREHRGAPAPVVPESDALDDDDLQLALYVLYELHYRSFRDVPDAYEWDPGLLAFRSRLEHSFEVALRAAVRGEPMLGELALIEPVRTSATAALRTVVDRAGGPSLSRHLASAGTMDELREFAVHRSAYQLKEADPHTWAIPRLTGEAKAAMVRIQFDEYGLGERRDMHATLFADTMRALGLDERYGAYLDVLPGSTLATVNLVTMFGLHRRLRAALVGHLAVFEMTSVIPMSRYSTALARLGIGVDGRRFYDAHVVADEHHQVIALDDLAGGMARADPAAVPELLFGAAAVLEVERRFATALLDAWARGESSLRPRCLADAA
jgi:hypothetical protein